MKQKNRRNIVTVIFIALVAIGIFVYLDQEDGGHLQLVPSGPQADKKRTSGSKDKAFNKNRKDVKLGAILASKRKIEEAALKKEREEAESSPEDEYEPNVRNLSVAEIAKRIIRNQVISKNITPGALSLFLDSMIDEQPKNEIWTKSVATEINKKISQGTDLEAELKEINCYSTLCKIVTLHESNDHVKSFYDSAKEGDELDGPGHRITKVTDDNRVLSTFYMARNGEDDHVHDALYNRMYEQFTGKKFEDIEPTEKQIERTRQTLNANQ